MSMLNVHFHLASNIGPLSKPTKCISSNITPTLETYLRDLYNIIINSILYMHHQQYKFLPYGHSIYKFTDIKYMQIFKY